MSTASRFRFRAWDKDSESMMPGDNCGVHGYTSDETGMIDGVENHTLSGSSAGVAENIVLMQSTGLLDKNGVEIFEGDIVEWTFVCVALSTGKTISSKNIGCIEYYGSSYYFCDFSSGAYRYNMERMSVGVDGSVNTNLREINVVGNIHENPELLEG